MISAKTVSMPEAASNTPISRIPGVSISQPPASVRCSDREVVVWRPRASSSRMPPVARSVPQSAFASVDLPVPDMPISATVRPAPHHGARACTTSGALALSAMASTSRAAVRAAAR